MLPNSDIDPAVLMSGEITGWQLKSKYLLMKQITIAIDGYSSCGKSTLAKALAAKLGYSYVDSGAMYRAATLFFLRNKWIKSNGSVNESKIIESPPLINLSFRYNPQLRFSETYLNEENVEQEIRQMEVSNNVSKISTIKKVREKMIHLQKEMGKNKGVVMEGRDIGTAVFPDAELKLFMTADSEVRIQRRYDEMTSKGEQVTMDQVRENLEKRDYSDTHRKENPLVQAQDAIVLDNSDLDKQQQLDYVITLINDLALVKDENNQQRIR